MQMFDLVIHLLVFVGICRSFEHNTHNLLHGLSDSNLLRTALLVSELVEQLQLYEICVAVPVCPCVENRTPLWRDLKYLCREC